MRREHAAVIPPDWIPIVVCPFDGDKINYVDNTELSGTPLFIVDPITGTNQCAKFTSGSNRLSIPISVFPKQDSGRCKIELDVLFYNHSSPAYGNIIDNSDSGGGGIFAQKEGTNWRLGISNRAYNISQTPPFTTQIMNVATNLIPLNTWLHYYLMRNADEEHVVLDNNGVVIAERHNYNMPAFDASLTNNSTRALYIGCSSMYNNRQLNGCIKNFMLSVFNS